MKARPPGKRERGFASHERLRPAWTLSRSCDRGGLAGRHRGWRSSSSRRSFSPVSRRTAPLGPGPPSARMRPAPPCRLRPPRRSSGGSRLQATTPRSRRGARPPHTATISSWTTTAPRQHVGLRFRRLTNPRRARITRAYVQFEADERQREPTRLLVEGEAADDAATFTSATVTSRAGVRTARSVSWSPRPWQRNGADGTSAHAGPLGAAPGDRRSSRLEERQRGRADRQRRRPSHRPCVRRSAGRGASPPRRADRPNDAGAGAPPVRSPVHVRVRG